MKQLERIRVRSSVAPHRIGRRNPPRPPKSPTIPLTTPRLCGYSSPMYLNVDAMPKASDTPSTKMRIVNGTMLHPSEKVFWPSIVAIDSCVGGYDSRNRAIHATHSTHHVTLCAPKRSASHPPSA